MVRIRLARYGRKKRPFYHIVVADSRAPRDGKFIEKIGHYDSINKSQLFINEESFKHWISRGAQPSETVIRIAKKFFNAEK